MQRTLLAGRGPTAAALALVLCGAAVATSQGPAQPASSVPVPAGTGGLWISESPLDDGRRLLIVVDGASRRAAVYHVDPASGGLTLRSARDLTWDLALDEFNVQEPRPSALRKMLQGPPAGPAAQAP